MGPAVEGSRSGLTARLLERPFPHELDGITLIIPPVLPTVTVMELVPWPDIIVHPDGTIHVYTTPLTGVTE
jgi:hypothetical protein